MKINKSKDSLELFLENLWQQALLSGDSLKARIELNKTPIEKSFLDVELKITSYDQKHGAGVYYTLNDGLLFIGIKPPYHLVDLKGVKLDVEELKPYGISNVKII